MSRVAPLALTALLLVSTTALAGDAVEGWRWQSEQTELNAEGIVWNDYLGDGQDRWKSGGVTQSFTFPERIFDTNPWTPWFKGRASGIEVQARAVVVSPDNTAVPAAPSDPDVAARPTGDRPYAQYFGLGGYLRSDKRPRPVGANGTTLEVEDRLGAEIGWIGEPLFLFDVQDAVHDALGMAPTEASEGNSVGSGVLLNAEGRRTWRVHRCTGTTDVQVAPYVDVSAGMRQNDVRAGADLIWGRDLSVRSWNMDPATGAMIPGSTRSADGLDWAIYAGGDVGYVASDALLGGNGLGGPSVDPEPLQVRLRAGAVAGTGRFQLHYGVAWLSPEFHGQDEGQLIGAISVKLPF